MAEDNVFRSSLETISDISQDNDPVEEPTRAQLVQALDFMKKEYESLNRQYFIMKDKLDQAETQVKPHQPPLAGSDNFQLQNQIFQLKSQVARLKVSSMQDLKKQQLKHSKQKQALHAQFDIRLGQAKQSYNKELRAIEQMLSDRKQQQIIEQQQQKLAEFLAEIERLEKTVRTLEKDNLDLTIKNGELEKNRMVGRVGSKIEEIEKDRQISKIRDENARLQQNIKELVEENDRMRGELQVMQLERQRKSIQTDRLIRKSIDNDQSQIQKLKTQTKSLQSQYDACKQLLMSKQVQLLAMKQAISIKDQQLLKLRKSDSTTKVQAHRQHIQDMADHIRRLNENIKEVERTAEDDKTKLSAEILRLKKVVSDRETELAVVRESVGRRSTTEREKELLARYDGKVAECNMLAASLKAKISELQEVKDKAAAQVKLLQSDVSRKIELQAENLVGEEHLKLKDQQLRTLASQLEHQTQANQHLQSQYDRLRQALQDSLQRQQSVKPSPSTPVSPTPQYLKLIEDTSKLNQQLTEQLQNCYSQIQQLQKGSQQRSIVRNNLHEQRQQQLRQLEKENMALKKDLMEVQISSNGLMEEKRFLEGTIDQLKKQREELRERAKRIPELEIELAEKERMLQVLGGDVGNLQNRLSAAQQALTSKIDTATKLKDQLNEKAAEIVRLNTLLMEKSGEVNQLKDMCSHIENLTHENNNLLIQRNHLAQSLGKTTEQLAQKSMSQSRTQSQNTIQTQQLQLNHLNGILQHLQNQLSEKQTSLRKHQNQVQRLHNQVGIVSKDCSRKDQQISQLTEQLALKNSQITDLARNMQEFQSQAQHQMEAAHQEIVRLDEALRQYSDLERGRVEVITPDQTEEIEGWKAKVRARDEEIDRLRQVVGELEQEARRDLQEVQIQTSHISVVQKQQRVMPQMADMHTSVLNISYRDVQTSHLDQGDNHEVEALKHIIAEQQQFLRQQDQLRDQNNKLKQDYKSLQTQAQILIRQQQNKASESQQQIQKMSIQLAQLSVWNQQLQDHCSSFKQQRDSLLKDKQALALQLDQRRDQLLQFQTKAHQLRLLADRLKQQNQQLRKYKFELDRELMGRREHGDGRLGAQVTKLEAENQKHVEMVERVRVELGRNRERVRELEEVVAEEGRKAELEKEKFELLKMEKAKSDRLARNLETNLKLSNEAKQQFETKSSRLEEEIKKYRQQLANRRGDYEKLMNEYQRLKFKNSQEVMSLQQNINRMNMLLQKQKQDFEQKNRQKFEEQTAYFNRLNETTVKLEEDLRRLRDEDRRHKDQIGLVNREKAEMFAQLARIREQNQNLTQQLMNRDQLMVGAEGRLQQLSKEIRHMKHSNISLNMSANQSGIAEYIAQLEEKCRILEEINQKLQKDQEFKNISRVIIDNSSGFRGNEQALRAENAALMNKINEMTSVIQRLQLENNELNINFERFKRTANKQYFDARNSEGTSNRGLYAQLQRLNAMLIAKDQQLALLRNGSSRMTTTQLPQFSQSVHPIRIQKPIEPSLHSPLKFHTLIPVSQSSTRLSPQKSTQIRVMQESTNYNPEVKTESTTTAWKRSSSPVRYSDSGRNVQVGYQSASRRVEPF